MGLGERESKAILSLFEFIFQQIIIRKKDKSTHAQSGFVQVLPLVMLAVFAVTTIIVVNNTS